jgi:hypothetical protein
MSGLSLDDAQEAKDEATGGRLRDNAAGIPDEHAIDWDTEEGFDDVKLHPTVLVAFDHIARISINDYGTEGNILAMAQNLEGAGRYGFDIELTVANPTIVDGQLWEQAEAEYPEYKILGDPDGETNPYELRESIIKDDEGTPVNTDVEGVGQLPGGRTWDGERLTGTDADYMQFTISGSRGMDVLGALDTAGTWFTSKEGDVIEGLFEVPPSFGTDAYDPDTDPAPRLTGYPELRADMVGQRGAILCSFDTDDPSEADTRTAIDVTLLRVSGEDMAALAPLTPEDEAYAKPTYPRLNNAFWGEHGSGDGTSTTGAGVDAEPQTSGGVASAQKMVTSSVESYEDLTEDGQAFVDDAVEAIETVDHDGPEDFADPSFTERVENHAATSDMTADAEAVTEIVTDQL